MEVARSYKRRRLDGAADDFVLPVDGQAGDVLISDGDGGVRWAAGGVAANEAVALNTAHRLTTSGNPHLVDLADLITLTLDTEAKTNQPAGMTSNSSAGFVASASSNSAQAYLAFDSDFSTLWGTTAPDSYSGNNYTAMIETMVDNLPVAGAWLQLDLPMHAKVNAYHFTSAGAITAPRDWVVAYSADGSRWFTWDSQTAQTFVGDSLRTFTPATAADYARYLRVICTKNNGAGVWYMRSLAFDYQLYNAGCLENTSYPTKASQLAPKAYVDHQVAGAVKFPSIMPTQDDCVVTMDPDGSIFAVKDRTLKQPSLAPSGNGAIVLMDTDFTVTTIPDTLARLPNPLPASTTQLVTVDPDGVLGLSSQLSSSTLTLTGAGGNSTLSAPSSGSCALKLPASLPASTKLLAAGADGAMSYAEGDFLPMPVTSGILVKETGVINTKTIEDLFRQASGALAVGYLAGGDLKQGAASIAIGDYTGMVTQGSGAVAVGDNAGSESQSGSAVAIGEMAGNANQGARSVAVGYFAGTTNQGARSVAIGSQAGIVLGADSIAIGGCDSGLSVPATNAIVLNASGADMTVSTAGSTTIRPVRSGQASGSGQMVLQYNPSTYEMSQSNFSLPSSLPASTSLVSLGSNGTLLHGDQTIYHGLSLVATSYVKKPDSMTSNSWNGLVASASTSGNGNAYDAFNTGSTSSWQSNTGTYDATSGAYTSNASKTFSGVVYSGEWLQLDFGTGVILEKYCLQGQTGGLSKAMKQWWVGTSLDGTTWTLWQYASFPFIVDTSVTFTPTDNARAARYVAIVVASIMGAGASSFCAINHFGFDYTTCPAIKITAAPLVSTDAANKGYVDTQTSKTPLTIGTSTITSTGTVALSLPSSMPASTSLTSLTSAGQLSASALKVPASLPGSTSLVTLDSVGQLATGAASSLSLSGAGGTSTLSAPASGSSALKLPTALPGSTLLVTLDSGGQLDTGAASSLSLSGAGGTSTLSAPDTGSSAIKTFSGLPSVVSLVTVDGSGSLAHAQPVGHSLAFTDSPSGSKMPNGMTSASWTSGSQTFVVSASGSFSTSVPYKAFDSNGTGTFWCTPLSVYNTSTGAYTSNKFKTVGGSNVNGEWIQLDFGAEVRLTAYYITTSVQRSPRKWVMAVSDDGNTWTTWQAQTTTYNFADATETAFTPTAPVICRYAVLIVTENSGVNNYFQISALSFDYSGLALRVKNLALPANGTDGANKSYVDSHTHTSPLTIGTSTIASTGTVALSLPSSLPASTSLTSLTSAGQLSASALKVPASLPGSTSLVTLDSGGQLATGAASSLSLSGAGGTSTLSAPASGSSALLLPTALPSNTSFVSLSSGGQLAASSVRVPASLPGSTSLVSLDSVGQLAASSLLPASTPAQTAVLSLTSAGQMVTQSTSTTVVTSGSVTLPTWTSMSAYTPTTDPNWVLSHSSAQVSQESWRVFDGVAANGWTSLGNYNSDGSINTTNNAVTNVGGSNVYGEYFTLQHTRRRYRITSFALTNGVTLSTSTKSFTLAGSDNGSTWTLVWSGNFSFTTTSQTLNSSAPASTAFYYYHRFIVTSVHSSAASVVGTFAPVVESEGVSATATGLTGVDSIVCGKNTLKLPTALPSAGTDRVLQLNDLGEFELGTWDRGHWLTSDTAVSVNSGTGRKIPVDGVVRLAPVYGNITVSHANGFTTWQNTSSMPRKWLITASFKFITSAAATNNPPTSGAYYDVWVERNSVRPASSTGVQQAEGNFEVTGGAHGLYGNGKYTSLSLSGIMEVAANEYIWFEAYGDTQGAVTWKLVIGGTAVYERGRVTITEIPG